MLEQQISLDETIDDLLEQGGFERPPVDAIRLADRLGIEVALDASQASRGRHARLSGRSTILLRPDDRPERLQWAAAHELGEVIAYRHAAQCAGGDGEISPELRESLANRLASRILLPSRWFLDDAVTLRADLLELKQIYRTASHELIALRLLDLGEPTVISIFDHGHLTRRTSNNGERPPLLLPIERAAWEQIHATNRPVEKRAPGIVVQGWPVHEPGWKREFLRTTATSDE